MLQTALISDRSIIGISGDDVEHFLENLITCKVEDMSAGECRFGALLSPQGKILFDFFLLKDNDFKVDIKTELADEFRKRMMFYKLRAKVDISAPEALSVFAAWGGQLEASSEAYKDPRHPALGYRVYEQITQEAPSDYDELRISIGIPEGGKDFEYGDAYPHETLMDQFGGVDFKKGCYVGQEVVSRMQHRGSAKKRVVIVRTFDKFSDSERNITADGKPAGVLGSYNGNMGLALLRLDRVVKADQVLAGTATVEAILPDWVTFSFPEAD